MQATAQPAAKPFASIPDTVSPQAAAFLRGLTDPSLRPAWPAPDDLAGWSALRAEFDKFSLARSKAVVAELKPTVEARKLGGVPVLDVRPASWKDDGKLLVYTHGGGYVLFSARSTLYIAALLADSTGLRVISVDYTLAPQGRWRQVTGEVASVFEGLIAEGHALKDMAILGESSGGGLAAGAVLRMRDEGVGMPAAAVLLSHWADVTSSGDTYATLAHAEAYYTYDRHLRPAAAAYADPRDQKNPWVSPVYADYSGGFPPTLIQGGTKELFMSNFVRHYQVLDNAGVRVKLDLYEGMPHLFQINIPDAPEAKTALRKVAAFLDRQLQR
jgi:acetyl esterase/lipase